MTNLKNARDPLIPPADTIRQRLNEIGRESDLLRRLLKLAEQYEEYAGPDQAQMPQEANRAS